MRFSLIAACVVAAFGLQACMSAGPTIPAPVAGRLDALPADHAAVFLYRPNLVFGACSMGLSVAGKEIGRFGSNDLWILEVSQGPIELKVVPDGSWCWLGQVETLGVQPLLPAEAMIVAAGGSRIYVELHTQSHNGFMGVGSRPPEFSFRVQRPDDGQAKIARRDYRGYMNLTLVQ